MPTSITVSSVTGSTPYELYLCLTGGTPCYYMGNITSGDIPYSFNVPYPIQDLKEYCVRIVDNDGCEITNCFTVT